MFSLKLKLHTETRRLSLPGADVKSLRSRATSLFPELRGAFKITYNDKSVTKTILTNADLAMAVSKAFCVTLTIIPAVIVSDKINPAEMHKEMLRAISHFRDEKRLRPVETREVAYTVVDVKEPKARVLGRVVPSKTEMYKEHDHVTQLLFNRIRHGPSAIEDSKIRVRIVKGNFTLKHVEPVVRSKAVILLRDAPLCRDIASFEKSSLRSVNASNVKDAKKRGVLAPDMLEKIVRFRESHQLNHVVPKISDGLCPITAAPSAHSEILNDVSRFDSNKLRSVQTRVSHKPIAVAPFSPRETPSKNGKKAINDAIVRFNKKKLHRVSTRVTHVPVVRPTLSECHKKLQEAVMRFDKKRLCHVQTRATNKPVVRMTVSECNKEVLQGVLAFNKKSLRSVKTRVSSQPVVRRTIEECTKKMQEGVVRFDKKSLRPVKTRVSTLAVVVDAPKATSSAAVSSAAQGAAAPVMVDSANLSSSVSLFQANLNHLAQMGFADRKRNIAALVTSRNNLEAAVLDILGA